MTAPDRPPPAPLDPPTPDEQLRRWVLGDPVHRDRDAPDGGECCPDFSCCRPELLAPPEVRLPIAAWDRETGAGWSVVPGIAPGEPDAYLKRHPFAKLHDYRTPLLLLAEHADDIARGMAYANELAREHIPRAKALHDLTGYKAEIDVMVAPEVYDLIALAYARKGADPPPVIVWPFGVRLVRRFAGDPAPPEPGARP